ncbi:MAG: hypothetical protein V3S20_03925, partial [Dehalococcoidia bacterium]
VKPRLFVSLFVGALLFALSTVAGACGGGDGGGELTLEQYFQRLEAVASDYEQRGDALFENFGEEFDSEEEQVQATQEFWKEFLVLLQEFVGDLDDVNPPSEAEAAHEESVDAGGEMLEAFQELVDQVTQAESITELAEGFDDIELDAAGDRFEQACVELQGIADDNGIDVDLNCGEE